MEQSVLGIVEAPQRTMKAQKTQQQRVLEVLQSLRGDHDIPEEYIRRHPTGDDVSARYFKQVMLISEVNGRVSELRAKGYDIETSKAKDRYGFAYHRLRPQSLMRNPAAQPQMEFACVSTS
jgi:hypothetical protein